MTNSKRVTHQKCYSYNTTIADITSTLLQPTTIQFNQQHSKPLHLAQPHFNQSPFNPPHHPLWFLIKGIHTLSIHFSSFISIPICISTKYSYLLSKSFHVSFIFSSQFDLAFNPQTIHEVIQIIDQVRDQIQKRQQPSQLQQHSVNNIINLCKILLWYCLLYFSCQLCTHFCIMSDQMFVSSGLLVSKEDTKQWVISTQHQSCHRGAPLDLQSHWHFWIWLWYVKIGGLLT